MGEQTMEVPGHRSLDGIQRIARGACAGAAVSRAPGSRGDSQRQRAYIHQ